MKRTILLTAIAPLFALAFLFSFHAQAAPQTRLQRVEALQPNEKIITVQLPDGHRRAFKASYRPEPVAVYGKRQADLQTPQPLDSCSYDFVGEVCEYDAPTGLILCTSLWWSTSCQAGMLCYNWFGTCPGGCTWIGECVPADSTWLLN